MRERLLASIDAEDASFLDSVRLKHNARSLTDPPAEMELAHEDCARLLALADECLKLRREMRAEPPPQTGPAGFLCAAGIDEASGEFFVRVAFADQETARRAGPMLFKPVTIEEVHETPQPANASP